VDHCFATHIRQGAEFSPICTQDAPCTGVRHVRDGDKCEFVKQHCQSGTLTRLAAVCTAVTAGSGPSGYAVLTTRNACAGSLINYLHVYYCHVEPAGWTARLGFQVLCSSVCCAHRRLALAGAHCTRCGKRTWVNNTCLHCRSFVSSPWRCSSACCPPQQRTTSRPS
jgi:hypothetical protein